MAAGRRRAPGVTRSERCAGLRALRPALVLAALALLAAASGCDEPGPSESEGPIYSVEEEPGETIHADHPCGPSGGFEERYKHFLYWTRDGAHLVFDFDDTIWALNSGDARLREIADVSLKYQRGSSSGTSAPKYGFYADVSPDGSQIVYSTCEYGLNNPPGEYYEIAVVNVDGTGQRRLTEGERFEGYPAWSPDGTQIVFITNMSTLSSTPQNFEVFGDAIKLAAIPAEPLSGHPETETQVLLTPRRIALSPQVWSPDGRHLAYVAYVAYGEEARALYTTGVDLQGRTGYRWYPG